MFLVFIMAIQPVQHLLSVYLWIAAAGITIWSYILNEEYAKFCLELLRENSSLQNEMFIFNRKALQIFFFNYVSQTFLAIGFCFSARNLPNFPPRQFFVGVLFIVPTLINAVLPHEELINMLPIVIAIVTFSDLSSYAVRYLTRIPNFLWMYITSRSLSSHASEILYSFETNLRNFEVFQVLQAFGASHLVKDITFLVYDNIFTDYYEHGILSFSTNQLLYIFKHLVIKSCDNIIAACGTVSFLTLLVDSLVYKPVLKFIIVPQYENSISRKLLILFIMLSIQLGITNLESELRFSSVAHVSLMMVLFALNEIREKICDLLQSLSVMGNSSYSRHVRVLISTFIIILICLSGLIYMFQKYEHYVLVHPIILSTEIIVSLFISVVIHILNLINLHSHTGWYEIYDYIFYLESTKTVLKIILAKVLLVCAAYSLYDSGGILRMLYICAHFYHHVWCVLIDFWNTLKKRRTISRCVTSLPKASEEEIVFMGGVCAICYDDLRKVVSHITRCNHFFHGYCLRKWLDERNICPICHRVILFFEQQSRSSIQRAFHMHED
ncbi:protein TRC8 homolog isoform X2 [Stegodyphus dumicola]|nr:protein TRC8 homolog isoform X2 [Stegodyphus dumicola]